MGRHSPSAAQGTRVVSFHWIESVQRYLFRFLICQSILQDAIAELPEDRKLFYIERLRGIDTRMREVYYGIQNTTDGTT